MGRPQILWGPGLENVLQFAEVLEMPASGTRLRDGSEQVRGGFGIEDSWITGYDYTLAGEIRWIPEGDTSWPASGWGHVQDFLDWARDKNSFRYVPDASFPDAWVDGCFLVKPLEEDVQGALEFNDDRRLSIEIRNPTYDFSFARRGVFLDYEPGMDIAATPWLKFSGAGQRTYATKRSGGPPLSNPILRYAPAGVPRDGDEYLGNRLLRLERAATNLITQPENLAAAYWVASECTITDNANDAPNRGKNLDTVVESVTPSVGHSLTNNVSTFTITADGLISATVYLQSSTRRARVYVGDAPATNRLGVDVDLIAGTILANVVQGTGAVMKATKIRTFTNGSGILMREVSWIGILGGGITTARFVLTLMDLASVTVYTGDGVSNVRMWGVTVIDGAPAGIYPGASRVQDYLTFNWPWVQQACWVYLKFVELGAVWHPTNASRRLFAVEGSSGHRFLFFNPTGGGRWSFFHDATTGPQAQVTMSVDAPLGSVIELMGILQADGSVRMRWTIDGGAEGSAGPSSAVPFIAKTPWGSVVAGLNHGGTFASPLNVSEVGLIAAKAGWDVNNITTIALARAV